MEATLLKTADAEDLDGDLRQAPSLEVVIDQAQEQANEELRQFLKDQGLHDKIAELGLE